MFGIGSTELLVILVVALIVLGPKSLAGFSRSLGKMVGEFRRVSTDFQRTLNYEAAQEEMREKQRNSSRSASDASAAPERAEQPDKTFAQFGPDSPLAKALQKTHDEAVASSAEPGKEPSHTSPESGRNA